MRYKTLAVLLPMFSACALYDENDYRSDAAPVIAIDRRSPVADGEGLSVVTVDVPPRFANSEKITLKTSHGSWVESGGSTMELTVKGRTRIAGYLRAPNEPGLTTVRAEIGDVSTADTLRYGVAYPDAITITPDKFTITGSADANVVLNVRLLRSSGRPSPRFAVQVRALNEGNENRCGCTVANLTDGDGVTSFKFFPGTVTTRTTIDVLAIVTGVRADTARVKLTVVPPSL